MKVVMSKKWLCFISDTYDIKNVKSCSAGRGWRGGFCPRGLSAHHRRQTISQSDPAIVDYPKHRDTHDPLVTTSSMTGGETETPTASPVQY